MADYTDLDPTLLRASVSDGTDLKPSLTTSSYSGGTPSAAADLKPSIAYADGTLKPSIADSVGVKASWLLSGSARPPTTTTTAAAASLTLVDSATVSGGAVATVSLTVNLVAGASYRIGYGVECAATGTAGFLGINSDTADTDYRQGIFQSDASSSDRTLRQIAMNSTGVSIGDIRTSFGGVGLLNSTPYMMATQVSEKATARGVFSSEFHVTDTTVTTIELQSAASIYADGTWLKVWRVD